jgi:hypothetical protein
VTSEVLDVLQVFVTDEQDREAGVPEIVSPSPADQTMVHMERASSSRLEVLTYQEGGRTILAGGALEVA